MAIDNDARGLAGAALGRVASIPVLRTVGHSYVNGAGATNPFQGYALRAARALGAQKHIYAGYSGSVSCHATNGGSGDGGVFWVLNTLHQVTGAFGGVPQVSKADSKWGPRHCVLIHEQALNDLGWLGTNTQPMIEAHRTIWAAFCRTQLFHWNAGAAGYTWTSTGTWAASSYGSQQSLMGGCSESATVGSVKSITLPSDMPAGRVLHFGFTVLPTDSATVTIKQNGTVVKIYTINGAAQCNPATGRTYAGNGVVCRTGVPGDGITWQPGDIVTITVASVAAGSVRFNYMGVEADPLDGPVWAAPLPTRLTTTGYAFYATYFSSGGGQGASMNDAVIDAGAAALRALCSEFPSRAIPVDMSVGLSTAAYPAGSYASDGFHPNDDDHGRRARLAVQAIKSSGYITDRVVTAFNGPVGSFWYSIRGSADYGASALLGTGVLNSWTQYDSNNINPPFARYPGYNIDQTGRISFRGRMSGGASGAAICSINQFGTAINRRCFPVTAGIDDVWTLTNTATGGTFTLTITETGATGSVSATTSAIAYNASAATVQSAIGSAVAGWFDNDVSQPVICAGTLAAGMTLTFSQGLGGKPFTVTVNGGSLTGGSLTPVHTTTGSMTTATVEVTGGAYTSPTQANYLIPRFTGSVSWIDLSSISYSVDA